MILRTRYLVQIIVLREVSPTYQQLACGGEESKDIGTRLGGCIGCRHGPRLNLTTLPLPHPITGARVNALTTFR